MQIRGYERIKDKDNKDRGPSEAMLIPYYFYYMRILIVMKQRIILGDAKPVLWNH